MIVCPHCRESFPGPGWTCPRCRFAPAVIDGKPSFAPELAQQNEGFKPGYFDQLHELEAGSFWFQARNRIILWALRSHCAPFASLLEIGCGTGYVLAGVRSAFPDVRLFGSEIYSAGIAYAAKRVTAAELFQMDARRMPFRDEFDVIGAFDVLEHIDDDEEVLRQMHRSVRPGGSIIVTVPQHRFLWSYVDDYSHHVRRYSRSDLADKVRRSGFKTVHTTSFVSLLLPLLLLSRKRVAADGREFDPGKELRISGWKNGLLGAVMTVERALLQAGLSLPAGGSLLLVATKPS